MSHSRGAAAPTSGSQDYVTVDELVLDRVVMVRHESKRRCRHAKTARL